MSGPVCLVILDGFGIGAGDEGDATARAETPFFGRADLIYPRAQLETSGRAVGLPEGQMGNSEVGHMTLGSGRIVDHDLIRVQRAVESGALGSDSVLRDTLERAGRAGGRLHLLGLVSGGGVHSSLDHLDGILDQCQARGIAPVLHAFTDGRDTPPQSALTWLRPLEQRLAELGGCVATVSGRFYAMDRDRRWARVARAVRAIVAREGHAVASAVEAVEKSYARGEGDEFIEPSLVADGPPLGSGDVALFFNFRADRARELTNALTRVAPEQLGPEITELSAPGLDQLTCLTIYDESFGLPAIFPPLSLPRGLGEILSLAGRSQLRIAETEKYAHVTYFFNGGVEAPFSGESRILIPSPTDVPTYDRKPEMSAIEVTDRLLAELERDAPDFVLVNYANPDMVGHTGILEASVRAVEVVDACLDRLAAAVLALDGCLLISADHGNIEQLLDAKTGQPHTAHTTNPVPVWCVTRNAGERTLVDGGLADVAPTLCELLGLERPEEMTGRSLLRCADSSSS